jgi:hypothetical protein
MFTLWQQRLYTKELRLWPAKPPVKIKKVYKRPQKRCKIASLSVKKKANVKKVFTNDFKTKDLKKE